MPSSDLMFAKIDQNSQTKTTFWCLLCGLWDQLLCHQQRSWTVLVWDSRIPIKVLCANNKHAIILNLMY